MADLIDSSKSTLLRDEKQYSDFPKPLRLGGKTTLYDVEKVVAFYRALAERGMVVRESPRQPPRRAPATEPA